MGLKVNGTLLPQSPAHLSSQSTCSTGDAGGFSFSGEYNRSNPTFPYNYGASNTLEVTWSGTGGSTPPLCMFRIAGDLYYPEVFAKDPLPDSATKIIIHNYNTEPYTNPLQTEDLKLWTKWFATIYGDNQPWAWAGLQVYFRVIDPRDTAPYAANPHSGDNQDTVSTQLTCGDGTTCTWVSEGLPGFNYLNGVVKDVSTSSWPEINSTSYAGGDNYQIEASFDPTFSRIEAISGTITVWKRGYIEHIRMFKTGEFLTRDAGSGSGNPSKEVYLNNVSSFHSGDKIFIFSATHPSGETNFVASTDRTNKKIVLQNNLTSFYASAVSAGCTPATTAWPPWPYCANPPYSFITRIPGDVYDTYDVQPRVGETIAQDMAERLTTLIWNGRSSTDIIYQPGLRFPIQIELSYRIL